MSQVRPLGFPLFQVHHLHYRTLGKERMSDLRVLCKDCHSVEHENKYRATDPLSVEYRAMMTQAVINSTRPFSMFTFDMLKGLVEEMNRYNESPRKAMRLLNVDLEYDGVSEYVYKVFLDGKPIGGGVILGIMTAEFKETLSYILSRNKK